MSGRLVLLLLACAACQAFCDETVPDTCASLVWIENAGAGGNYKLDFSIIPNDPKINYGLLSYPSLKRGETAQTCFTPRLRPVADHSLFRGVYKAISHSSLNKHQYADVAALEYALQLKLPENEIAGPVIVLNTDVLSTDRTPCSEGDWRQISAKLNSSKVAMLVISSTDEAAQEVVSQLQSYGCADARAVPNDTSQISDALAAVCRYNMKGAGHDKPPATIKAGTKQAAEKQAAHADAAAVRLLKAEPLSRESELSEDGTDWAQVGEWVYDEYEGDVQ